MMVATPNPSSITTGASATSIGPSVNCGSPENRLRFATFKLSVAGYSRVQKMSPGVQNRSHGPVARSIFFQPFVSSHGSKMGAWKAYVAPARTGPWRLKVHRHLFGRSRSERHSQVALHVGNTRCDARWHSTA